MNTVSPAADTGHRPVLQMTTPLTIESLTKVAADLEEKAAAQREQIQLLMKARDDLARELELTAKDLADHVQAADENTKRAADLRTILASVAPPPRTRPDDPGPDRTSLDGPGHARTPAGRIVATTSTIHTDTKPVDVPKGGAK